MALPIKKKAWMEAERLIIKPYSPENADGLVHLLMNPEITKTFMVPGFESVEQRKSRRKMDGFQAGTKMQRTWNTSGG